MKKIITILMLVVFASVYSYGQSQRLVLAEEFTQASCGPCAAANPTFNALLQANPTKITAIKYQTNWPGVDPMNTQTQTWVGPRVTYYNVSGVPYAIIDGDTVPTTGGSYTGYPNNFTQTKLDAEYAVPSPFTMVLTHTVNTTWDSMTVKCVITCTQAITVTGPLEGQIVMTENHIHFATAPGSNGETDFYNVARAMYPSATGTPLATTWTVGQKDSLIFKVKIPTYIYNKGQIAFVAFIQDNATKYVKQAAYSAPIPCPLDAGITAISNVPAMSCTTTPFTPSATLTNYGTATLTGCNINYKVDAGTVSTINWTGTLATNGTTMVTLGAITPVNGQHTLSVYTSAPNGGTDLAPSNDATTASFLNSLTYTVTPLVQDFQSTTWPPSYYIVGNPDNDAATWTRKTGTGGFGTSTACTKMDFYNSASGRLDDLYTDPIDLNGAISASLSFDVAYKQYSASYSDRIQVQVSTNCGSTWSTKYDKQGATLATVTGYVTSAFTPTATQWRTETVDISSVAGQANVLLRFHAISAYGNNAYVDNVNITSVMAVNENSDLIGDVSVYPNPLTDKTNIIINLKETSAVSYIVYNVLGEVVSSDKPGVLATGSHEFVLNASNLSTGMYYINIMIGDKLVTKKITVNR